MKIKSVSITDKTIGDIVIYSELSEEVNDIIGTMAPDHDKFKFYFADILKNEDGVYEFRNVRLVRPKGFNVGFHSTSGGSKNFTTLYVNEVLGDFDIYPNGIVSVKYKEDESNIK
jgi:hypothetical protein